MSYREAVSKDRKEDEVYFDEFIMEQNPLNLMVEGIDVNMKDTQNLDLNLNSEEEDPMLPEVTLSPSLV